MAKLRWLTALALGLTGCGGKLSEAGGEGVANGGPVAQPSSSGGSSALSAAGGTATAVGGTTSAATTADEGECPDLMLSEATGMVCDGARVTTAKSVLHFLVVLDKSSSMATQPAGFSVTKWEAATQALLATMESSTELVHFGLLMFPYSEVSPIPTMNCGARCCELPLSAVNVEVDEPATSAPTIVNLLEATEPSGATPTAQALKAAHEYYVSGNGATLPSGQKFVLLLTDGGPNCNNALACEAANCTAALEPSFSEACSTTVPNCCDDQYNAAGAGTAACLDDVRVLAEISALANAGIKTFVVGLPGSEAFQASLTQFARAGGVTDPNSVESGYFAVTANADVTGLTQTLKAIVEPLWRDCDIKLAQAPRDANLLNVIVECTTLSSGSGEAVNWVYNNDPDDPTITFKGSACETIQSQGVTRVDVIEGCSLVLL